MKPFFALSLCLLAGHAAAQGITPTQVVIGQSAPLSGANAELGKDIRNGALAYFRKVNDAGGVHGRKIELVSLDDANAVQRAGENTQKLVEEQKVFALFGYASATLSRPALPWSRSTRRRFSRRSPAPIRCAYSTSTSTTCARATPTSWRRSSSTSRRSA